MNTCFKTEILALMTAYVNKTKLVAVNNTFINL